MGIGTQEESYREVVSLTQTDLLLTIILQSRLHFLYLFMLKSLTLTLLAIVSLQAFAQSKLDFDSLLTINAKKFARTDQFSGPGWDHLIDRSKRTNYILIGEDHFISEIPVFTQAFTQQLKPDNYIAEIDQWMFNIFTSKITKSTPQQLDAWITSNYNGFSFFQKKNEFELMRSLVAQKTNLYGTEQVGLMSAPILYQYLSETGSPKNKKQYEIMRDSSNAINNRCFADMSRPFFFVHPLFKEMMGNLDKSSMKPDELALTEAMLRSAGIYTTGSHKARIKLMQQNLMALYPQLKGKKNVFKFGANHTLKGESYIPVYDIGTTAHIFAQAENQDSYHIIVLPKSGQQAGFLGGKNDIDLKEGIYAALRPMLDKASNTDWTTFDLEAIRSAIRKHQIQITDDELRKTIFGYDALVVIPVATSAATIR